MLVDLGQLLEFGLRELLELDGLACDVGVLGVALGGHRGVFAGSHRQRAGHDGRHPRNDERVAVAARRGHADEQARSRTDAVLRAEDRGAEPADAIGAMRFGMESSRHGNSMPAKPG